MLKMTANTTINVHDLQAKGEVTRDNFQQQLATQQ